MTKDQAARLVEALVEDGYRAQALNLSGDPNRWGVEIMEPLGSIKSIPLSPALGALLSPRFTSAYWGVLKDEFNISEFGLEQS